MIYNFFCFKCGINLIDNCRIICRKTKMCHFNITFLHKFLYRITITSMESLFLQKNLTKKTMKRSYSPQISVKLRKNCLYLKKESTLSFIKRKTWFFQKRKFYKGKFVKTCMSYKKSWIIFYKNVLKFF